MYDNWTVVVAEVDGRIAGWTGWTVKQDPNKKEKHAYLTELMVHSEFRRMGVATRLVEEAEKNAHKSGANHIYCGIF